MSGEESHPSGAGRGRGGPSPCRMVGGAFCRFGGGRSRDAVPNRGVAGAIRRIRRWERAEALGASPVEPWKESRERGEPWNHESPGAGNHLTGWTLWTEDEEAVLRSGGDGSRHLERDLHTLLFGVEGRDAAPSSEREMERPLRKRRRSTRGMKLVTELVRWFPAEAARHRIGGKEP